MVTARILALMPAAFTCIALPVRLQVTWNQASPANSPPPLQAHAMAFEPESGITLLFGGFQSSSPFYASDLWAWDGTNWSSLPVLGALPPGREALAAAFDAHRDRLVIFGGYQYGGAGLADAWEWERATSRWHRVAPASGEPSPSGRLHAAMAYDEVRREIVLFGGLSSTSSTGVALGDTWIFDGAWRQVAPAASPVPRLGHSMCFDRKRGRVLLFGGGGANPPTAYVDTWEWTGTNWVLVTSSGPFRRGCSFAYDPRRERVVANGGGPPPLAGDTWELDGTNWFPRTPSRSPTPLTTHAAAYDEHRGVYVMFGGWDGTLNGTRNETWLYTPINPGTFQTFAPGCRGNAAREPLLRVAGGTPWIGSPFELRLQDVLPSTIAFLALGASRTSWNGIPLPLDLGWWGMPGCRLATSYEQSVLAQADTAGIARWTFGIPAAPALIGARFYAQAFALDPSANARQMVLSNANEAVIGEK